MERSVIREQSCPLQRPGFASLHPGCATRRRHVSTRAVHHVLQRAAGLEARDLLRDISPRSRRHRCRRRCAASAPPSDGSRTGCPAGSGSVREDVERGAAQRAVVEARRISASFCKAAAAGIDQHRRAERAVAVQLLRTASRLRTCRVSGVSGSRQTRMSVWRRNASSRAAP